MDLSSSKTKRKNPTDEGSIGECSNTNHNKMKLRVTDSNVRQLCDRSCDTQFVVISGLERRMTSYNPLAVHRNIISLIGNYVTLKPLSSGDLLVQCANKSQFNKMLECDNLGDKGFKLPIKVGKYFPTEFKSKAVISGVPMDLSDAEILDQLKPS